MAKAVIYNSDSSGYRVALIHDGQIVDEYVGGNNPHDSQAMASPGYPAVPESTLRKWARKTALEMAAELGIPRLFVARDPDLVVSTELI